MSNTTEAYSNFIIGSTIPSNPGGENSSNNVNIRLWIPEVLTGGVVLRIHQQKIYQYVGSFPFTTEDIQAERNNGKWQIVLEVPQREGLRTDWDLQLLANTEIEYELKSNAKIFALEIQGAGYVTVGSASGLDDVADFESVTGGVLQLGFINHNIFIKSDTDVTVSPIIYVKN